MKLEASLFGMFAFIQSFAIVLYFSPVSGSFWGGTFFGIPYPWAAWAVPILCGALAISMSYCLLRKEWWRKRRIKLGLAVATLCFLAYAVLHALLVAVAGQPGGFALLAAILLFGGLFFLPMSLVLAVIASLLGARLSVLTRHSA